MFLNRRTRAVIIITTLILLTGGASTSAYAYDWNNSQESLLAAINAESKGMKRLESVLRMTNDEAKITEDEVLVKDKTLVHDLEVTRKTVQTELDSKTIYAQPKWTEATASELDAETNEVSAIIKTHKKQAAVLNDLAAKLDESVRQKTIQDARSALKEKIDAANAKLSESNGRVDSEDSRADLQAAINGANGYLHDEDVNNLKNKTNDLQAKIDDVDKAIQARNDRIDREQAEAAARAAAVSRTQAYASSNRNTRNYYSRSSYNSGTSYESGSNKNSYSYSKHRDNGRTGYTTYKKCTLNAFSNACQGAINGGWQNQMTAMDYGDGTVYGLHSNRGGSSALTANGVTINGQHRSFAGPAQQAQYVNGHPYLLDGSGDYYQTCGPDGKVYLRPLN